MAIKTFKRYEKKYSLNDEQFSGLMDIILEYMEPDKYCVGEKSYTIFNIYYDTEDNDIIRNSLKKPYYKEKLRLRSYKPFCKPSDTVFLELKKKIGGIVSKRRASMTLLEAKEFINNGKKPCQDNYLNGQVIDEIAFFLEEHKVSPKVFLQYDRKAFFGKDNPDFRLTFDDNILSRRTDLFTDNNTENYPLLENGRYIMEIKINESIPMWLSSKMAELNIKKTSFSKYGTEYTKRLMSINTEIIYYSGLYKLNGQLK